MWIIVASPSCTKIAVFNFIGYKIAVVNKGCINGRRFYSITFHLQNKQPDK